MLTAGIDHFGRPVGGLHLTDVCLAQKEHAKTGLTDTAACGIRKLSRKKCAVERKLCALGTAAESELTAHSLLIYTDTHRGQLQSDIENRIVYKNIAVERPVIVIGRASVMRLAAFQVSANALKKYGTVLLGGAILALLSCQIGVSILQLLCRHKGDLGWKKLIKKAVFTHDIFFCAE